MEQDNRSFTEKRIDNLKGLSKLLIGGGALMTVLPVMPTLGIVMVTFGALTYPYLDRQK